MNPIRIRNIVLSLAAIFAVLFLMATYGTSLPGIPFAPVSLNGPVLCDSDGNYTAIVDAESRRMLIMNGDGNLTGYVDCSTIDSPVEVITDVSISNGFIFVSGAKYVPDSTLIERERIAAYDKGGNLKGVLYEKKSENPSNQNIKSIVAGNNGITACVAHSSYDDDTFTANYALSFLLIDDDGAYETSSIDLGDFMVYDAAHSLTSEHYAIIDQNGRLIYSASEDARMFKDHVFTAIDLDNEKGMYACDDETGAICKIDNNGTISEVVPGSGYEDLHVNSGLISYADKKSNTVHVRSIESGAEKTYLEVVPSFGFSVRMAFVWICGLYLAILVIVLIARKAHKAIATGQTQNIGPIFASVAVVIAVSAAFANLSYAAYQTSLNHRTNEVNMCADYLRIVANNLSGTMETFCNRDAFRGADENPNDRIRDFSQATIPILGLVESAVQNNIGLYFTIYGQDSKGIFRLVDSEGDYVFGSRLSESQKGSALEKAFLNDENEASEMHDGRSVRDTTRYRLVPVYSSDGSSVIAVIEIGSKTHSFEASILDDLAGRLLGLLVLMIVVYLTYSELRRCGRCMLSYRRLQERHANDAVAVLTRPFTFGITLLTTTDSVMTVLIARELLTNAGESQSSLLLAVPAIMLGLGVLFGQILYGTLGSRVGLRRLMAGGAFVMLLCAIFAMFSVTSGLFWLYCVAKLVMAVPFGLLYALGYSLPRIAKSSETRIEAAGGVKRTDTSAAALGTVLGSYAAHALGNAWVYAIIALICLPIILMALGLLPKGAAPLEHREKSPKTTVRLLRFIRSSKPLAIAFLILLPATIAAGYTSFIFPLFSSDLGLTKTEINNIYVLGQVVVYLLINGIDSVENRYGKWRVATIAITLLGGVFLLFSLNTTLTWSILVVALIAVLGKSSDGWKAMWVYSAGEAGISAGRATSTMLAARSVALIAQPFILGALLSAANSVTVIILGLFCVLCAASFFLITRRSSLPDMR